MLHAQSLKCTLKCTKEDRIQIWAFYFPSILEDGRLLNGAAENRTSMQVGPMQNRSSFPCQTSPILTKATRRVLPASQAPPQSLPLPSSPLLMTLFLFHREIEAVRKNSLPLPALWMTNIRTSLPSFQVSKAEVSFGLVSGQSLHL